MWIPSSVLMLCTLLSYIDRQTLAVLSPMILPDTGLNAASYADALSAFSIAYMIANPLWGSILDYVGLRRGMIAAVAIWTVASVSHAWVAGALGFTLARIILGVGEGAAFPGGFRTATDSLPPNRQMRGMALAYSGASLGTIITPLMVTPLALWWGWRTAFLLTGAFGASWLALWWFVARPPWLSFGHRSGLKLAWPNLFEKRFWMIVSSFGLGGFGLGVTLYLSPLYLNGVMGLSQAQLGKILWIPSLGYEAGYFFWGWIADRYVRADLRRAARIFVLLTVLALPGALLPRTGSLPAVLALFFWTMFIADGFIVTSLRMGAQIYRGSQTGMVAGIGSGAWSAVLAVMLPFYGRWFDTHAYTAVFTSMSLIPMAGTAIWLGLWWSWRSSTD